MTEITVAGRQFVASSKDIENGDLSYSCEFIARRRKRYARLVTYSNGSNPIIHCDNTYGLKYKDKMNHTCISPEGIEFAFCGSYVGFEHLFNINEDDVKKATRTKKATTEGWSFKRRF